MQPCSGPARCLALHRDPKDVDHVHIRAAEARRAGRFAGDLAAVAQDVNIGKGDVHRHRAQVAALGVKVEAVARLVAAVAASLVNPRKDALLQLNINPQERARLNALIMASTIALSSPFGYLAGWLSSLDRRLPFVFSFVLFLVAMLVISRIQEPSMEEETA